MISIQNIYQVLLFQNVSIKPTSKKYEQLHILYKYVSDMISL